MTEVYDNATDAEAARLAGVEVDYSTQVRGDDGLTDDERRLEKIRRGEEAQRKSDDERERQEAANGEEPGTRGRAASSDGNKSEPSSDETGKSDGSTKQDPLSTARTTEPPSNRGQTASSTARSTGTSGKAKR